MFVVSPMCSSLKKSLKLFSLMFFLQIPIYHGGLKTWQQWSHIYVVWPYTTTLVVSICFILSLYHKLHGDRSHCMFVKPLVNWNVFLHHHGSQKLLYYSNGIAVVTWTFVLKKMCNNSCAMYSFAKSGSFRSCWVSLKCKSHSG